jgi:hypothetical protein
MKEHVVLLLVLLTTYLPIAAAGNLAANKSARTLVLWVVGLIALIGVAMDGEEFPVFRESVLLPVFHRGFSPISRRSKLSFRFSNSLIYLFSSDFCHHI